MFFCWRMQSIRVNGYQLLIRCTDKGCCHRSSVPLLAIWATVGRVGGGIGDAESTGSWMLDFDDWWMSWATEIMGECRVGWHWMTVSVTDAVCVDFEVNDHSRKEEDWSNWVWLQFLMTSQEQTWVVSLLVLTWLSIREISLSEFGGCCLILEMKDDSWWMLLESENIARYMSSGGGWKVLDPLIRLSSDIVAECYSAK